jgi:two-component system sensor histidine kinase SenX3
MNITRRRGAIAFFITLGVCLVGVAVALNIGWVVFHWRGLVADILGFLFGGLLIAGMVIYTIFLVREIRHSAAQESFLNAVTHELKTPIASIRLYLETLQRHPVDDAKRQEFYRIMLSDSERLLGTVNTILKAAETTHNRRDRGRKRLEMTALTAECIAIARERMHLPADAIQLETPAPGMEFPVIANEVELHSAILNVLDNAVKYSGGNVRIRARLRIERSVWVMLDIEDAGIGIAPENLKRIFKRFYRVSRSGSGTHKIHGTGLGLFIVRAIARQHGGDVTAASEGPGKGSTITLQLPVAPAAVADWNASPVVWPGGRV